ncbi:MAG: hypothetical protein ACRD2T_16770 [Thermoanaerobaculia bacterium]
MVFGKENGTEKKPFPKASVLVYDNETVGVVLRLRLDSARPESKTQRVPSIRPHWHTASIVCDPVRLHAVFQWVVPLQVVVPWQASKLTKLPSK